MTWLILCGIQMMSMKSILKLLPIATTNLKRKVLQNLNFSSLFKTTMNVRWALILVPTMLYVSTQLSPTVATVQGLGTKDHTVPQVKYWICEKEKKLCCVKPENRAGEDRGWWTGDGADDK